LDYSLVSTKNLSQKFKPKPI